MKFNWISGLGAMVVSLGIAGGATAEGVFPVEEPPAPEIQIFFNYYGYNRYSKKIVSLPDRLFSAGYLYPNGSRTAACFKGEPYAAAALFQEMVAQFNAETGRSLNANTSVYFDPRTSKPALHIEAYEPFGPPWVWFPRMRECDRRATPEELANLP